MLCLLFKNPHRSIKYHKQVDLKQYHRIVQEMYDYYYENIFRFEIQLAIFI